ncbi:F-box domain-containing protein [Mycena sanguinolenta]|uniref:F-box domain-containing protein n=1 Tax=Mycena sanguinolenta TaxID=230812 RepID=A0A8H6YFC1_9AGAR|nr:F-box domain-containing protein [Mycena sanguinolenta]
MTLTGASVRAALLEQRERTKRSSKAEIERFIEESELEVTSIESQIAAFIESRDSHRARVLALKYIASPIYSLPVELLSEIFDLAIEDETHVEDAHRISQVCSDWRRVAHHTPRLWTRTLGVYFCDEKERMADGLKAWLARSAPLPVSILFAGGGPGEGVNPSILEEALRVAHRWRSLQLENEYAILPRWFLHQLSQCRLHSLEELDLGPILGDDDEDDDEQDTDSIPMVFASVPRLRKLRIFQFFFRQTVMPCVQLTDLTIDNVDPNIALDFLAQCPNLLVASVTISGWPQVPGSPLQFPFRQDVLVLNQLSTLVFRMPMETGRTYHITPFFDLLSAPLLQALYYTCISGAIHTGHNGHQPTSPHSSSAHRISLGSNSPAHVGPLRSPLSMPFDMHRHSRT